MKDLKIRQGVLVKCSDRESIIKVFEIFNNLGLKWRSGSSYKETNQEDLLTRYLNNGKMFLDPWQGTFIPASNEDSLISKKFILAADFIKLHEVVQVKKCRAVNNFKRGDILTYGLNSGESLFLAVLNEIKGDEHSMQAQMIVHNGGRTFFGFKTNFTLKLQSNHFIREATEDEKEIMLQFLSKNNFELEGGEVKKKRWFPSVGEKYWMVNACFLSDISVKELTSAGSRVFNCFKTERAALDVAHKLKELILNSPQE